MVLVEFYGELKSWWFTVMRIWEIEQKELVLAEETFEEDFFEKGFTQFVKSNPSKKINKIFISQ